MLFVTASTVPGGSSDRAVAVSFDDGASFSPLSIGVVGLSIVAPAHSVTRGETLFLNASGRIFRTPDGVTVTELTNDIGSHAWQDMIRVDALGLYIACATDMVKTSPDGLTWTAATIPSGSWIKLGWNPYTSTVTVGKQNNTTQSLASSTDAVTFALVPAMGFATSIYESAQAADGSYLFGNRADISYVSSPDLATFVQRSGIVFGGQVSLAYDATVDLFALTVSTYGIYTIPPLSPGTPTLRSPVGGSNPELYGGMEDVVAQTGGGFIGVRPLSGGITRNSIIRSDATGLSWSNHLVLPYDDNTPTRIINIAEPIFTVPDIIGLTEAAAVSAVTGAGLVVGTVTTLETNAFPAGTVLSQFPTGGATVDAGTAVSYTLAVPDTTIVPNVIGMTLADAENAIRAAGFLVGDVSVTTEPLGPLGTVVFQTPPGGSTATPGTKVALTSTALLTPFDVDATVISQYSNSPTINRLVENMADYLDPSVNLTNFYNFVWNVDTAVGFGLDIWGNIVGVSRLLRLPSTDPIFGYINADDPPDWEPFNEGIFFPGDAASQAYFLPDDSFRTLILTKALANIVATNAASLNALLRNLFPGRGKAYVLDLGGMAMQFVFEFSLTTTEFAILTQSGALPHPAGVSYSVTVVGSGTFGFAEAGPSALPFDFGVFYLPP